MPKGTRKNRCIFRDSERVLIAVEIKIKEKGLSNTELSLLSGVDAKKISRYRKKWKYSLSQHELLAVCEALGIHIDVKISYI